MKVILSSILLLCFSLPTALAVNWGRETVATGDEVGASCAVAVDRFGRVHTAYSQRNDADTGTLFKYLIRESASNGFDDESESVDLAFFRTDDEIRFLAMDITDDLVVQIVIIDSLGLLRVFESQEDGTFDDTVAVFDANPDVATGGVDIESRESGIFRSAIVYHSTMGLRVIEQGNGGSWNSGSTLISGSARGQRPSIINTPRGIDADSAVIRVVAAYDDAGERIETVRQNLLNAWSSSSTIRDGLPITTTPDLAFRNGKLGVSFTQQNEVSISEFLPRPGTTGDLFLDYQWMTRTVVGPDGLDETMGEFYGQRAPFDYDLAGEPTVVVTKNLLALFIVRTLEISEWRRIPVFGWSQSVIETLPTVSGIAAQWTTDAGVDLVKSTTGDPALVYERDRGDESDLVFARPIPDPWVIRQPDEGADFSISFAPAMTTNERGDIHLMYSVASGGTFLNPTVYQMPRLETISDGVRTSASIPASVNPIVSWAVADPPQDTIHLAGLRLTELSSEAGDILHYRKSSLGNFELTSIGGTNVAAPGPVILEYDGQNLLYVAFLAADGNPIIYHQPNGGSFWEMFREVPAPAALGMDFAVRPDGGMAVSYYNPSSRRVAVYSNIDARSGGLLASFVTEEVRILSSREREPSDTAVALSQDGKIHVSFTLGGNLFLSSSRAVGGLPFQAQELSGLFGDATLEMETRGDQLFIGLHSARNGGTLHQVLVQDGLTRNVADFASPQTVLSSSQGRQSLAFTVDANGFPMMAVGMFKSFGLGFLTNKVVVAQPADGLDEDGDGIPLLSEEAHCLSPRFKNSKTFLPRSSTRVTDGGVSLRFSYRAPKLPRAFTDSGTKIGDFVFTFETSSNLQNWMPQPRVPGEVVNEVGFVTEVDDTPFCEQRLIGRSFLIETIDEKPKQFAGLNLLRDR